jgi:ferric-dicitrate binding protein FerR (iron transport regulator)
MVGAMSTGAKPECGAIAMTPNELEPDDINPIADQNTERLLAGAYRPETPDPAFIARVTAAMQAEAARRAIPAQPAPVSQYRLAGAPACGSRWIGWAAAAGLLLAFGVVAGAIFLARPGYQRQDGTVWIDGKAYVEADAAARLRERDRLRTDLQSHRIPFSGGSSSQLPAYMDMLLQATAGTAAPQGTGLVARPQPVATAAEVLQVGRSAETLSDQRRRLALADGSILYLNRDTAITLTAPREVTLRRGEIYVEVAQDPAAARFIVSTRAPSTPGRRQMIALGTKFDVRVAAAGTELLVTQGKVQVSDLQLPVLAGQQLLLDGDAAGPPDISAAPRATHTIEWIRELMAAAHSPLVPGSKYSGGAMVAVDPQGQETRLSLRKYRVDVHIEDGFARTTIDQTYFNQESGRLEGTFYFPLPPDASLSRLAMYVNGRLMEGGMAERQHAREVFDSIVYRMKDPALLEWVDGSTFKMRVFPLEGRQEKRIILSYTQRLPALYGQTEYRFPGGHSLPLIGDWSVHVRVKNGAGLEWQGEPQFTATKLAGDLLLDAAAKEVRPDRDIIVRMKESPLFLRTRGDKKESSLSLRERARVRGDKVASSTGDLPQTQRLSTTPSPRPDPGRDQARLHPNPLLEGEGTMFSSAVSDGSKYLMLCWRPELPGETQRQRRDWIFLFESSADRDPLLARAQVEIVKTILNNAEHDDTFSILTAATRVHAYENKPQTAAPANVRQAVRFLENVHLVGALDLGRAFDAARPLVEAAKNPVLVHVGAGLPALGLRDLDALVNRLPERAAYVGVGVGNRWSRALMKSAAARSGGCFTQINPDEQIVWRALDLLATLNTPRLLGIHVNDAAERVQFLTCEDSLAQGEQLCAIARLDAATELPKTVEIAGQLDGKPRKWTVHVAGVAEQAHYLPRTWAKLEIDRLVADGGEKNKDRIIELSKAMYVMSPFTSLLVLENEQMYVQYHVDRGRKDHWAMYACPERIPVVFEPLVGPQAALAKAEAKGKTVEEVLSTVLVRLSPAILGRPGERRQNGLLTVLDTATSYGIGETKAMIVAGQGASAGTQVTMHWQARSNAELPLYSDIVNLSGIDSGSTFALQMSYDPGATAMGLLPYLGDGPSGDPLRDLPLFIRRAETQTGRLMFGVGVNSDAGLVGNITLDEDVKVAAALAWLSKHQLADGGWRYNPADPGDTSVVGRQIMALRIARQRAFVDSLYQIENSYFPFPDEPPIVYPDPEFWRELTARRMEKYSSELSRRSPAEKKIEDALKQPTRIDFVETPLKDVVDYLMDLHHIEIQLDSPALKEIGVDESTLVTKNLHGISLRSGLKLMLDELQLKYVIHNDVLLITSPAKAESDEYMITKVYPVSDVVLPIRMAGFYDGMSGFGGFSGGMGSMGRAPASAEVLRWILPGCNRKVPTYQPPVFSNNRAVFYDLVSYAPAMHTNLADVLAVLEAETCGTGILPASNSTGWKPVPQGKIDDRARRLIERARGAGWQTATIADAHGKTPLTVAFDGTGRYRYEQTTSAGLREQVVCDGASLWHLYPELGIGARRAVSRFHHRDFARLVPWALPAAEDLARGADLVSVDERTVAIVPQDSEAKTDGQLPSPFGRWAGGAGGLQSKATRNGRVGTTSPHPGALPEGEGDLCTHLVFAPDGRLAQRQLVEMPAGRIRIRESYAADGTVEFVAYEKKDAGGTPTLQRKIRLAPCGAPELKPSADLVVLPLPLRSRQQVHGARKLPWDETYGIWSEEDALAMIAADLGGDPHEMKQIIGQRFFRRGDRRRGFYTLLLSTGQTWDPKEKQAFQGGDPLALDPLADHPNDPLAKYVAAYLNGVARSHAGSALRGVPDGRFSSSWNATERNATEGVPYSGDTQTTQDFFRQLAEFHDLWDRWHDDRALGGDEPQRRQECQRALAFIEHAQSPELAWGLLMAVREVLTNSDFHNGFAAAIQRFDTVPGLEYAARYERARALFDAHDGNDGIQARDLFCKLFAETLDAGFVPPIDSSFREALLQGGDGLQWPATIRGAARKLIDVEARSSAVYLARQVQQVGDPPLAEEVFDMALRDAPENERLGLTLARIEHCRQTEQLPRADALLQPLLADKRYGGSPALWYLAEAIADTRGMTARAIGFRQRAMEIEFEYLPEKVNVEVIRDDYGRLLARYEKLATAIGPMHEAAPRELLAGVIRAADRWRQLDADPMAACQAAARILGELGETDLAWDYLTTPLSVQPNEVAGWANLARTLQQQGHVDLADRAYAAAFDAEPTNAQILWDRAQSLWENGRTDQARPLFRQIAAGPWGPQFSALQSRAKPYVEK